MIRPVRGLRQVALGLLALSLVTVVPAWAAAAAVIIKNDTPSTVILQGSYIVKGRVQRGKPLQVQPGDSITMIHPGVVPLTVTIADARLPVIIGQAQVLPATEDQHFAIQPDVPPKVKLEPVKAPR
jgi:hypothetical protein